MIYPVYLRQKITLEIEDLVQGGEGLGHFEGMVIFVPQGLPGDLVEIEIISVKPGYARGLIKKIIKKSSLRVTPLCPITKECGGCQWQELEYQEQLKIKEKLLAESFEKIGKIPKEIISGAANKIIGMANPYYYRNKAQFPFRMIKDQPRGGFYSTGSHKLVTLEKCFIQTEQINKIFTLVSELLSKKGIKAYDEQTKQGLFRHLLIRQTQNTNQTLVVFVVTRAEISLFKSLAEDLKQNFSEITGIVLNINERNTNVILGEKNITILGQEYITEKFADLNFKISVHSFFQVNPQQMVRLYDTVLNFAALNGTEHVLDAYAGTGSIAMWLARFSEKLTAIEISEAAVADARENARKNNLENINFLQGKVEDLLAQVVNENKIDLLILDPPRKGCEPQIFSLLEKNAISRIIYVSCNPSTLARDSKILAEKGFELKKFQPVDMFPHTYHLETVVLFEKKC